MRNIAILSLALTSGCAVVAALNKPKASMQDVEDAKTKSDMCYLERVCYNEIVASHPGNQDGHFLNPVRKEACRAADISNIGPRPEGVTSKCPPEQAGGDKPASGG